VALTVATTVAVPVAAGPLAHALTPSSEPLPGCNVGEVPEFRYGFAALRLDLDANIMGEPVECEHALDAAGDTRQQTTRGLATYDHAANRPVFHSGDDNWALTPRGLEYWAGDEAAPPAWAVAIPSPGSARLVDAAARNSAPPARSVGRAAPAVADRLAGEGSMLLTQTQLSPVADRLGVRDDQPITVDEVALAIKSSGSSMAEVTRAINMASRPA
jgi:hypothetical protein